MTPFRRLNDAQLAELAPLELLAYIKGARAAGEVDCAVEAAQILAFAYADAVLAFIYKRLGHKGRVVVEEVAQNAIASAIDSSARFQGSTEAELRAFIFRIARRRIADFHRSPRGDFIHVPDERVGEDGEIYAHESDAETDPLDAVDRAGVFNQALEELNEVHRTVIFYVYFEDLAHADAAEEVNRHFRDNPDDLMTEENVNKIKSRFAKRLRELGEDD